MTSETARADFRGSLLDRMATVIGFLCAVPLIGAAVGMTIQRPLLALMLLILAAPLVAIWLLLALLMVVYRRRPSRWVLVSATAPAILILIGLAFGWLVLMKLVQS